jgi:hypothetical protein
MEFDVTDELLNISSSFDKYFRKYGNKMEQCIGYSDFKEAYDSGATLIIFSLRLTSL